MASEYLPEDSHILRHVPYGKQLRDAETEALLGILHTAFLQRPKEEYLSFSWLEFFAQSTVLANVTSAASAMHADDLKIMPKTCLASCKVEDFKRICKDTGATIRIIREETPNNPGHTAVRRVPPDNADLRERLAQEAAGDLFLHNSGTWYLARPAPI